SRRVRGRTLPQPWSAWFLARARNGAQAPLPADLLAGVENIVRIEGVLDLAHERQRLRAMLGDQEIHFVQADAMLAGTGAIHGYGAFHQPPVDLFGLLPLGRA